MIEFWLGGALLLALAALFLLFPGVFLRTRVGLSQAQSNRDWYERRKTELAADILSVDADLLQDARVRLLEDSDGDSSGAEAAAETRHKPQSLALGLWLPLALLALACYWQLGAAPDVRLAQSLQEFSAEGNEADYRRVMLMVEERAAQRPENQHYQAMLGRFYMNAGDYGRAKAVYMKLSEQAPGDASALALAAQASFLAADRQLDGDSQVLAERALSVDPHQRTALGLLGMVAYEKGQFQAAISYWRRLLVMEDPASESAQMIQGVIARAEAGLAATGDTVAVSPHSVQSSEPAGTGNTVAVSPHSEQSSEPAGTGGAGVSIRLELAAGADAAATDTVFVFARNPAVQSRMPVAVQRLTVAQLPLTLRLDDSNSMAGQLISQLELVNILARVSPSGQAGAQFTTLQAELSALQPDGGEQVHQLVLKPPAN
jgi:cytochrome c-type biogenesis protein CcmH